MTIKHTILVTQTHVRFGLNVAKSLSQAGYRLVVAAPQKETMCLDLLGVVASVVYPDPFKSPRGYVAALNNFGLQYQCTAIIPVHEDIFVAAAYRELFDPKFKIFAPPLDRLMSLHDKYNLSLLTKHSVAGTPPTRLLITPKDLSEAAKEHGLPLVIKPRYGEGAVSTLIIKSQKQLDHVLQNISQLLVEDFIIQPYFRGKGACVGCLMRNGRVIATSQHLRLREFPLSGGASTARATYNNSTLTAATIELLRQVKLDGVVMAEFKVNEDTGEMRLLDVNPRYWGGLSTHIESGVDYPLLHVRAFLEDIEPEEPVVAQRQVETRWMLGEMRVFVEYVIRGRWREAASMLSTKSGTHVIIEDGMNGLSAQILAYLRRGLHQLQIGGRNSRADFFKEIIGRSPVKQPQGNVSSH